MGPEFEDLPFFERPDLTPYLIHLTKNTNGKDAFDNLINILRTGKIHGSSTASGYIKGPNRAACFMDVPFMALKYILNEDNADPEAPKYEPFGVFVTKKYAYNQGCRPVLYLSDQELMDLQIPRGEWWRVVRFEVGDEGWISWIHEREWRIKGDFSLPTGPIGVLVKSPKYVEPLSKLLTEEKEKFASIPRAILPLTVICQGLIYLPKK